MWRERKPSCKATVESKKQAMIFAAGLGTRLKPLTDTMPKALVPVAGQPLLWHVAMKLRAAGFERIVVNVHHFASQIVDYLKANGNFGLDIRISDETGGLLETGGGIKKALPLFDPSAPILIHNVDILSNVDLNALYHLACEDGADALLLVSRRKTKRYLLFNDDHVLQGWTNIETGEVRGLDNLQLPIHISQLAIDNFQFSIFPPRLLRHSRALAPGVPPLQRDARPLRHHRLLPEVLSPVCL